MTLTPYAALGLSLLAVVVTSVLALIFSRPALKLADYRAEVQPKSRAFVLPTVHPTITLTPRQIERINIQRKLRGKPPFNRRGLSNAVAHPWDRYDVKQPQSTNDWISYLIAYEILFDSHSVVSAKGCPGINIDPNLPYNGQGGEYAGAGASGSWGDPITRAEASAIEHGVPVVSYTEPSIDRYQPGDTVSGYSSPSADPSPSYSSSDSSSSSSDSYSSSSSSDSSSSSSSDSGGGGGGGGE